MNLLLLFASVGYCGIPISSQASNIISTASSNHRHHHHQGPSIVAVKSCFLVHTTYGSAVNDTPQYLISYPNNNISLKQQYGECQQQHHDEDDDNNNIIDDSDDTTPPPPPPPPSYSFQSLTERVLSWIGNFLLFLWMLFPKLARATRSSFNKLKRWYSHQINVQPLITKSLSSGVLSFVGDSLAQLFEMVTASNDDDEDEKEEEEEKDDDNIDTNGEQPHKRNNNNDDDDDDDDKYSRKKPSSLPPYDIHRSISQVLEAIFISSPVLHYAYDLFEILLPTETPNATSALHNHFAALVHLLLDNLVMDAFFVASMLCAPGVYEGRSLFGEVIPEMKRDFSVAWKASLISSLAFSPVQFLCFRFLSVRYRVLAINCQDVVWTMAISVMAYRSRRERREGERQGGGGGDGE